MLKDQEFTPKYWMGHHKLKVGDVMLFSAHKTRSETVKMMAAAYGEDWFMDENFEIILVEINRVI